MKVTPIKVIHIPLESKAEIRYVPRMPSDVNYNYSCKFCSNNPENGGDGICYCINGQNTKWFW